MVMPRTLLRRAREALWRLTGRPLTVQELATHIAASVDPRHVWHYDLTIADERLIDAHCRSASRYDAVERAVRDLSYKKDR